MRHSKRWMVAVLSISAALQLSACGYAPAGLVGTEVGGGTDPPARVERLGGTGLNRVILSAQAARRLGIQTDLVRHAQARRALRKVVPYAAVLYDLHGATWVYTNPEPRTFVRARIRVDSIDGDLAVLAEGGPSDGTAVVTVGVPELYGTEFEGGLQP